MSHHRESGHHKTSITFKKSIGGQSKSNPRKKTSLLINEDGSLIDEMIYNGEEIGIISMEPQNIGVTNGNNKTDSAIETNENTFEQSFDLDDNSNDTKLILEVKQIGLRNLKLSIVKWLFGYFFVWFVFGLVGYFYFQALEAPFFKHYWEQWYVGWLCLTSFVKLLLKMISRQIDRYRIKIRLLCHCLCSYQSQVVSIANSKNIAAATSKPYAYDKNRLTQELEIFSMEWFTELIMSMLYWIIYRNNVVYYAAILSTKRMMITWMFHIASEMFETSFKLLKLYFNCSEYISRQYMNNVLSSDDDSVFFDDSNYDQWYVRCSIDIMIRFTVELVNGLWVIYFLIILGEKDYNETRAHVIKGMKYIGYPTASDVVYFIIQIWISKKFYNHNIIVYYRCVWQKHRNWFLMTWLCAGLLLVVMW